MRTYKITLLALLCSFAGATIPAPAEAARWQTCNGSPVIWRGGTTVHRNRCSIPDSGVVNTAYWNGINKWNSLSTVITAFFMNDPSDCVTTHGDGENEIGLVNRSAIDGANGLTILQLGLCFIGSNDIDEADIMIANDLSFSSVWGDTIASNGRATFVHEFGHFYGFDHDDVHAIMRTFSPRIASGGSESANVWPADTIGMSAVYGFSTSRPNLLPSAIGVVGGGLQTLDPALTVAMCRNGSRNTRVYLGNSGNLGTGTYNGRIRLSTVAPFAGYSGSTTVVSTFTHSLGAFTEGTFDIPFFIPSTMPFGTYFLYIDMDYTGSIVEAQEGDNSTVSAMRIQVNC